MSTAAASGSLIVEAGADLVELGDRAADAPDHDGQLGVHRTVVHPGLEELQPEAGCAQLLDRAVVQQIGERAVLGPGGSNFFKLIVHELGHQLGIADVGDGRELMGSTAVDEPGWGDGVAWNAVGC